MAARVFIVVALLIGVVTAVDHSPLQNFCVPQAGGAVQGSQFSSGQDFSFRGLHLVGDTKNSVGSKITPMTVTQLPGLNTLGVSLARIDFAQWGINLPHAHPRASEILVVIELTLEVGFITSNPDNKLITKTLNKDDVFVFPQGLGHFQRNVGYGNAVAIAALGSQNPGVIMIGNAVFGSSPKVSTDILAKAFPD